MAKMVVVKTYDLAKFHPSALYSRIRIVVLPFWIIHTHTPFIPWDAIKNVQCVPIIYRSSYIFFYKEGSWALLRSSFPTGETTEDGEAREKQALISVTCSQVLLNGPCKVRVFLPLSHVKSDSERIKRGKGWWQKGAESKAVWQPKLKQHLKNLSVDFVSWGLFEDGTAPLLKVRWFW